MKKFLFLLIFFHMQNFSNAATNLPIVSSELLIEMKTSGGYVVPDYIGHEEGLTIYRNGKVEAFSKKNSRSPLNTILLAQLSASALQKIVDSTDPIQEDELVSENPGAPMCTDLPETNYTLWKDDGRTYPFARNADCHHFFVKADEARGLKILLDGLRVLVP